MGPYDRCKHNAIGAPINGLINGLLGWVITPISGVISPCSKTPTLTHPVKLPFTPEGHKMLTMSLAEANPAEKLDDHWSSRKR